MRKILLASILVLGTTTMAFAAPVEMTDNQLDQVAAGQAAPPPTISISQTVTTTATGPSPLTLTTSFTSTVSARSGP